MMRCFALLFIVLCLLEATLAKLGDPYLILGLSRDASQQDIKKAYKKLVKEW